MTIDREWEAGELVAGHRLLRRLGQGGRASVWLAAPALEEDGLRSALKLYRADVPAAGILQEAELLWRARGRHTVAILDVMPRPEGTPVLRLEHVPHDLAEIVGRGISPGSTVTLLGPLATELQRLHERGIVHGGVRLGAVGLREDGAPVLLAFGGGSVRGARAPADEGEPHRRKDAADFLALARTIVGAAAHGGPAWDRLRAWLAHADPDRAGWLGEFAERVFDAAAPEPIPLGRDRLFELGAMGISPVGTVQSSGPTGPLVSSGDRSGLRGGPLLGRLRTRLAGLGGIRRRIWVSIAAAGLALIAAAIALPTPGAVPARAEASSGEAAPATTDVAEPAASEPASVGGDGGSTGAILLEDPARAAVELLRARARCYLELSIDCLAAVAQPGSDAEAIDRGAIAALREGDGDALAAFEPAEAGEIQRLGDASIVDVRDADGLVQRLLLMADEGGWRVRAYLPRP